MPKSIANLKIKSRLILFYSLFSIAIFIAASLLIYYQVRAYITKRLYSELEKTTHLIVEMVDTSAQISIKNHLRAIAQTNLEIVNYIYSRYLMGELEEKEAKEMAKEILLSQVVGKTGYVYAVDSNAVALIHPEDGIVGKSWAHHTFVKEMSEIKKGYSEYFWRNPEEPEPLPKAQFYTYFQPWDWVISATSYRSEFVNLVNIDDFKDKILNLKFGESGYATVFNSNAEAIIHPFVEGNMLKEMDEQGQAVIKQVLTNRNGKLDYLWRNPGENEASHKIGIYHYIEDYDWFVVSTVYSRDFFQPLTYIGNVFFAVTLLFVIAIVLLSVWLGSSISKPIETLTEHFNKCAKGNYRERMPDIGTNEIGQLSTGFNVFMDALEAEIADRKTAQQALKDSEDIHRAMLEASPNPVVHYNKEGKVLFVNQAFTRVFGWDAEELKGQRIDFVPKENEAETRKAIAHVFEYSDNIYIFETRRYTKSGDILDVSISAATFHEKTGTPIGMVVNLTDITRIKETESNLINARNNIRQIINSMPSVLIGVDTEGVISQWNTQAERSLSVPFDQAIGKKLIDLLPQLEQHIPSTIDSLKLTGIHKSSRTPLKIGDKSISAEITTFPLEGDQPGGYVVRVDDVSKQVEMEEMMIQSDKMLSIGGLAAGMAHEINNPLAIISQSTQLIRNRISPGLKKNDELATECGIDLNGVNAYFEKRKILFTMDSILSSSQRAARIVDNMLSFSRKGDHSKSFHYIHEILNDAVELANNDYSSGEFDFRTIRIERVYEDNVPQIPCEKNKIQQVFLNILQNGAQAMFSTSTASADPVFFLRVCRETEMVRIEVEDNGPGMDNLTKKRIFEPFYTTKEVGKGTGLGLSVSYFIITEHHGGTLNVETKKNQGANFIIRLPLTLV